MTNREQNQQPQESVFSSPWKFLVVFVLLWVWFDGEAPWSSCGDAWSEHQDNRRLEQERERERLENRIGMPGYSKSFEDRADVPGLSVVLTMVLSVLLSLDSSTG